MYKPAPNKKNLSLFWKIFLPILAVGVIAGSYVTLTNYHHSYHNHKPSKVGKVNYSPPPKADNNQNNTIKTSTPLNSSSTTTNSSSSPTNSSTSPSNVNFNVQIVNSNVANNNVHIGTLVNGTTTGNCNLTGYQSGQGTVQLGTSTVRQDVNNYDCGVFNIPTSKFPSNGQWAITLTVTYNGVSKSDSTNVNI